MFLVTSKSCSNGLESGNNNDMKKVKVRWAKRNTVFIIIIRKGKWKGKGESYSDGVDVAFSTKGHEDSNWFRSFLSLRLHCCFTYRLQLAPNKSFLRSLYNSFLINSIVEFEVLLNCTWMSNLELKISCISKFLFSYNILKHKRLSSLFNLMQFLTKLLEEKKIHFSSTVLSGKQRLSSLCRWSICLPRSRLKKDFFKPSWRKTIYLIKYVWATIQCLSLTSHVLRVFGLNKYELGLSVPSKQTSNKMANFQISKLSNAYFYMANFPINCSRHLNTI